MEITQRYVDKFLSTVALQVWTITNNLKPFQTVSVFTSALLMNDTKPLVLYLVIKLSS